MQQSATMAKWLDIPNQLDWINDRMARIERMLGLLLRMERAMGKEMDDLRAAVEAERTVTASVVTLLTDINQRLKDAVASGDPAALQAVVADLTANTSVLAAAVTANTPSPA